MFFCHVLFLVSDSMSSSSFSGSCFVVFLLPLGTTGFGCDINDAMLGLYIGRGGLGRLFCCNGEVIYLLDPAICSSLCRRQG